MNKNISSTGKGLALVKKPFFSLKNIVGCTILTLILTIFSLLELVVLILIFAIFLIFYVAIAILGSIYALIFGVIKLSKHYRNKKKLNEN